MKKATLTIGLFSLIMVLTSFTTPEIKTLNHNNSSLFGDGTAGQDTGRTRKVDFNGGVNKIGQTNIIANGDGTAGQDTGRTRKVD